MDVRDNKGEEGATDHLEDFGTAGEACCLARLQPMITQNKHEESVLKVSVHK